jgi:hypothetical protein
MEEHAINDYEKLYRDERNKRDNLEKENQYLSAKIKILKSTQNKGEKDEVLLLIELFNFNQTNQYDKLIDIFGEEASEGISICNINTTDEILDINKLSKAKGEFKADCNIQMKKTENIYCISIKSKNGANPAILNHTPRSAKVFQEGGILCDCIDSLDNILGDYIDKRNKKIIGEDTPITNLESLKDPLIKNKFMNVLTYFVFEGSGKGDSKCKANAIITYQDETITFIKCVSVEEKKEYIKTIYDTIILSLRDKGMPKVIIDCCKKWIFNDSKPSGLIKYKGSLHIRMK